MKREGRGTDIAIEFEKESGGRSVVRSEDAGNCSGGLKEVTLDRSSSTSVHQLCRKVTTSKRPSYGAAAEKCTLQIEILFFRNR
jgi:hypothetical protein